MAKESGFCDPSVTLVRKDRAPGMGNFLIVAQVTPHPLPQPPPQIGESLFVNDLGLTHSSPPSLHSADVGNFLLVAPLTPPPPLELLESPTVRRLSSNS